MKPHFQSTSFTTAASSLLTVLHHFKPEIALSKENEFHIWHNSVNLPTRGSSIYALAYHAKKHNLKPKIIVEQEDYSFPDYRFYRYTKEDVENAAFAEKRHLNKAKNLKVPIETHEITLKLITNLLKDNILILRLNTKPIRNEKRNTSNYIVVINHSNNYFQIIDPAFGALSIPETTMQEAFESLETKKHRDHRMIIFPKDL
tara:strand:- start:277 stop:882 length:606 start_codon:yes stop_codon:yes gene_type:complete